jgi:pyruvate/2-oxoglutarate dehydrogenase complex dihydrolipoamide dehydrogenase (E3) component
VTIVHRGRRILPKEDEDASRIIHDALLRDGATVHTGRTGVSISPSGGESGVLTLDDGSTIEFDCIVAAIGRAPHADALGLEHAGVRTDADGYVAVDAMLRTTNPRIWAAGDITGLPKFTHTAASTAVSRRRTRSWGCAGRSRRGSSPTSPSPPPRSRQSDCSLPRRTSVPTGWSRGTTRTRIVP